MGCWVRLATTGIYFYLVVIKRNQVTLWAHTAYSSTNLRFRTFGCCADQKMMERSINHTVVIASQHTGNYKQTKIPIHYFINSGSVPSLE
jgi:hypothetical protein